MRSGSLLVTRAFEQPGHLFIRPCAEDFFIFGLPRFIEVTDAFDVPWSCGPSSRGLDFSFSVF